ncbi:MAG: hypothetical protein RRA35_00580 [Desulfomonilia bacterium]|nr:hypothetical protein [Desulfomonilia bacterium]
MMYGGPNMIITVEEWWPKGLTSYFRERDMQRTKRPLSPYIRELGFKIIPDRTYIKAYVFYEIKNGHENRASNILDNLYAQFSSIPRYRYQIEYPPRNSSPRDTQSKENLT